MQKLRAWLKPNKLTSDPADFTAVPDMNGSVEIAHIVESLLNEGMEIKKETAVDIVTRFNRKAAEFATSGYAVNTGLVLMQPRIRGKFTGAEFDPARHKVYISVQQGVAMRKAIAGTQVEILGQQESRMAILRVEDMSTGAITGTLSKGKNAEITGTQIKVTGQDSTVGITFTNKSTQTETRLGTEDIVKNTPSRVLILVPNLAAGKYELSLTTQYSGSKLSKTPRTAVAPVEITIE